VYCLFFFSLTTHSVKHVSLYCIEYISLYRFKLKIKCLKYNKDTKTCVDNNKKSIIPLILPNWFNRRGLKVHPPSVCLGGHEFHSVYNFSLKKRNPINRLVYMCLFLLVNLEKCHIKIKEKHINPKYWHVRPSIRPQKLANLLWQQIDLKYVKITQTTVTICFNARLYYIFFKQTNYRFKQSYKNYLR
jgi:hypothetical protein